MAYSFMWTTIHVLLWNYVIYTSGGITSYGHEDKSIGLRRQQWYAAQSAHNGKRQDVRDTKPVTNGKFNEKPPIVSVDHMGNPSLRLLPSDLSIAVKKPPTPSDNRDNSRPKNNEPIKLKSLGNVSEESMLRTPENHDSPYLSLPAISPDTSYSAGNINNLLNNYAEEHTSFDDSIDMTGNYFLSSSPNEQAISPFMQRDNVSPQLVLKSSNPSVFSNEQLSNPVINNEPCDDNSPQPIKSLEQKSWNKQMQSQFFDFPSWNPQFTNFVHKPIMQPIPTYHDFFTPPSKMVDDNGSESSKFVQLLPKTTNSKFVYQKDSIFENKTPLSSSSIRFMAPLDTSYGEQIQSDWPSQMVKTSGIQSQSIPPAISMLYGQQHPIADISEFPKFTDTATIKSTSKPIPLEKVESTSVPDEQQQITNLSESSQPNEESSLITSSSESTPVEKTESTSQPDEQQQITELPDSSSELTEIPSIASTTKPLALDKEESTPSLNEPQQTIVTDELESPKLTEKPFSDSITLTSKPTSIEKEESTSNHEELPRPLPEPAKLVKTPAIVTKPTPISSEKKPSMFLPYEQPLINWSLPPQYINAPSTGSISPSVSVQDGISIDSLGIPFYENHQEPLSMNPLQFITPSEQFKYYNDGYQQILQQSLHTSQPIQNSFFSTRPDQNQVPFTLPFYSKPQNALSKYYSHILNENIQPCIDE